MRPVRAVVLVACFSWAGCERAPEPPPGAALPTPSASAAGSTAAPTIDVRKGRETAFGLQLPRGARLRTSTPASKTFDVPLRQPDTIAFVRERLSEVSLEEGPLATTLDGQVIAASRRTRVTVIVREASLSSEVTVRLEESADEAEPEPLPDASPDADRPAHRNPDAIEGAEAVL